MSRRYGKLAALFLALLLCLSGCNLIGVDPLMQVAEDRAAAQKVGQTVLAEYDGGSVTVFDILMDFNEQWSFYSQLSAYGVELDASTAQMLKEQCVQYALERVAVLQKCEELGIELSQEEQEALEQSVREDYDARLEEYKAVVDGKSDEVRAAQAEYYLYSEGRTYESMLSYERGYALAEKLRALTDEEVGEVPQEDIEQAYQQHVESDESYYAEDNAAFESTMTTQTAVYWMPEGYRTVKHILLIPAEEILQAYTQQREELETLEATLEDLYAQLDDATDDDVATGDPEQIQQQIDQAHEQVGQAEALLAQRAQACIQDVQDRLEQIDSRLAQGEDFQALIDEFGEDPGMQNEPTASRGYYVSATSTTWDVAFRNAAMLLENVGDVSEPVVSGSGVHLIRYESDVTPGAVPLEQVRDALVEEALTTLQEEYYLQQLDAWVEALHPVYSYDNWTPTI